jgi:hypothetical protein
MFLESVVHKHCELTLEEVNNKLGSKATAKPRMPDNSDLLDLMVEISLEASLGDEGTPRPQLVRFSTPHEQPTR